MLLAEGSNQKDREIGKGAPRDDGGTFSEEKDIYKSSEPHDTNQTTSQMKHFRRVQTLLLAGPTLVIP